MRGDRVVDAVLALDERLPKLTCCGGGGCGGCGGCIIMLLLRTEEGTGPAPRLIDRIEPEPD